MLNVNVRVLLYEPVRRASLAPIACLNVTGTFSLDVGPVQVLTTPRPCSGCGIANAPLTSLPVLDELGSATVSVASPAVDVTVASVMAEYSLATPGMNGAKEAGAPSVSVSVAGTLPPTVPVSSSAATSRRWDLTADWLPLTSTANHLTVYAPGVLSVRTSPMERARWLLYVFEFSVGVEPSVV